MKWLIGWGVGVFVVECRLRPEALRRQLRNRNSSKAGGSTSLARARAFALDFLINF